MSKILETALDQTSMVTDTAFSLRSEYGHHAEATAQKMVDFHEACQDQDQISFWLAVLEALTPNHQTTRH